MTVPVATAGCNVNKQSRGVGGREQGSEVKGHTAVLKQRAKEVPVSLFWFLLSVHTQANQ